MSRSFFKIFFRTFVRPNIWVVMLFTTIVCCFPNCFIFLRCLQQQRLVAKRGGFLLPQSRRVSRVYSSQGAYSQNMPRSQAQPRTSPHSRMMRVQFLQGSNSVVLVVLLLMVEQLPSCPCLRLFGGYATIIQQPRPDARGNFRTSQKIFLEQMFECSSSYVVYNSLILFRSCCCCLQHTYTDKRRRAFTLLHHP